jgi:hypothetical protein
MQWDEWLRRSGQTFADLPVSTEDRDRERLFARDVPAVEPEPEPKLQSCPRRHRHPPHQPDKRRSGRRCQCPCSLCRPMEAA